MVDDSLPLLQPSVTALCVWVLGLLARLGGLRASLGRLGCACAGLAALAGLAGLVAGGRLRVLGLLGCLLGRLLGIQVPATVLQKNR